MAITLTSLLYILLWAVVLAVIYYVASIFIGGTILMLIGLALVIFFIIGLIQILKGGPLPI